MDWSALTLSLKLSVLGTALLMLLVLPLAYILARRPGRLSSFLESLFSLPMVVPPTVLGFYLLLMLSSAKLAFTFSGLLLATVVCNLPFAFQPCLAAFQGVDARYFENARLLGEKPLGIFFRVALPLARNGILSGVILAFAHSLGEFGVVLMIGGNIPNVSRTLSIALYDQVESFNYAAANRTALLLLSVSWVALFLVGRLRPRPGLI